MEQVPFTALKIVEQLRNKDERIVVLENQNAMILSQLAKNQKVTEKMRHRLNDL